MQRAEFEQLISLWLDEPDRADLRNRIEAVVAADPELAAVLAEWKQFNVLLHDRMPAPGGVDWAQFEQRVSAAVFAESQPEHDQLDFLLQQLPAVDARVDWDRLGARISTAVTHDAAVRGQARQWGWMRGVAALALAAAAVLIVTFMPDARPVAPSAGLAELTVSPPPIVSAAEEVGVALVHIAAAPVPAPQPEHFLIIEPLRPVTESGGGSDYY